MQMLEFRCIACNRWLFNYEIENKAKIEVTCPKCNRSNFFTYNSVFITVTNYAAFGNRLVAQMG